MSRTYAIIKALDSFLYADVIEEILKYSKEPVFAIIRSYDKYTGWGPVVGYFRSRKKATAFIADVVNKKSMIVGNKKMITREECELYYSRNRHMGDIGFIPYRIQELQELSVL